MTGRFDLREQRRPQPLGTGGTDESLVGGPESHRRATCAYRERGGEMNGVVAPKRPARDQVWNPSQEAWTDLDDGHGGEVAVEPSDDPVTRILIEASQSNEPGERRRKLRVCHAHGRYVPASEQRPDGSGARLVDVALHQSARVEVVDHPRSSRTALEARTRPRRRTGLKRSNRPFPTDTSPKVSN